MSLTLFSLSMYTLSESEKIATILRGPPSSSSDESDEGEEHQRHNQLQSKSERKALRLKQDGNDLFRKKNFHSAVQRYTQAIFLAPWPSLGKRAKVTAECLKPLLHCSPSKYKLSRKLLSDSFDPRAPDDSEKQQLTGSPLLASCFGNRSAALYELGRIEECLSDIELAILYGYAVSSPEDKLIRRRKKCIAQRRKPGTPTKQEPSLSSEVKDQPPDTKFLNAFESEHVIIKSNESCGRFIEAARDLQLGDILFSEEPYAAVLDNQFVHTHCSYCFKESLTLIPCCHCSSEGYCRSECRREAWKRYHWLECRVADMWKDVNWMMRLCLRIVVRAGTDEILSVITGQGVQRYLKPKEAGYAALYSLVTHEDKFLDASQKLTLEKMSDNLLECFGDTILRYLEMDHRYSQQEETPKASPDQEVSEEEQNVTQKSSSVTEEDDQEKNQDSTTDVVEKYDASPESHRTDLRTRLRQLFRHHLLQLRCNSHFVSAVMSDIVQESADTASLTAATRGAVETTSERKLGSVIYTTTSLMNHSCAPNVIFRFTGNRVTVCVTENIKAGNEINNSYGPQIGRMKRFDRQKLLRNRYFFDCNCVACSGSIPELTLSEVVSDALLCPRCKAGPLKAQQNQSSEDSQESYRCLQCNSCISSELLSTSMQKRTEARTIFNQATSGNEMSISLLLGCLKEQSKVLHKHNLELAKTNDALAQAYAMQGDFQSAVSHCQNSCEAVGVVYGSNSVEVAQEKEKLSQLLFHNGCYDLALRTAREALKLLHVYRGEEDQSCQELEEMMRLLSMPN